MVQTPLPVSRPAQDPPRYRWVVLGAGVFAQASAATVLQGMPSVAPALRERFSLSLPQLGLVLAAGTIGLLLTLVPWGALADRIGERLVMSIGLIGCTGALVCAGLATTATALVLALVAAGAACASVNAASGRAVLLWFPANERGFAMGARQTAIPAGAALAALGLPAAEQTWGLAGAFYGAAVATAAGAVVVAVFVREHTPLTPSASTTLASTRSPRVVRRLCAVSILLVIPQLAVVGFMVVYLVDEHDMNPATAAALLAVVQLGGGLLRIAFGIRSDRIGKRIRPLLQVAVVISLLFLALAASTTLGGTLAVVMLIAAGFVAVSWNGLAFTAVGEAAEPSRLGLVLGIQNTAVAAGMVLTPPILGAVVDRTAWGVSFALAAGGAALAAALIVNIARLESARTLRK
ncbi:MFS transporter [Rhodococcus sp. NPDC060084]|uniref:MFS transporter n=1 Tax=Rhodococcus sp. NPDC060084 TaxID=3347053 RepID=UPI00366539C9